MSISSALNASIAGLNVNSIKMVTISDNIANSGTYGYKRADAEFASMVLSEGGGTYSAGGVRAISYRDVADQGNLTTTGNGTDIAIAGEGFLPVTDISDLDNPPASLPFQLTSTGSFRPDADGFLRTQTGLTLLGWPVEDDGSILVQQRTSATGLEPVTTDRFQVSVAPTTDVELSLNLPAGDTAFGAAGAPYSLPLEYFDNLGGSQTLTLEFTPDTTVAGQSNLWTVDVYDSATGAGAIATFDVEFDDTRGLGGAILDVTAGAGAAWDPAEGVIGVSVAGGPLDLRIGQIGSTEYMTQVAGDFAPYGVTKNGAGAGELTGVNVTEEGLLVALYDTGQTRTLYQIPVVNVPNPNGLRALDNQALQVTRESGDFVLWDSGEGPAGKTVAFALEESTTDLVAELTELIQTQRAYSSNAKIVQTVDEMMQETTNLKR